jgi:hypothetical protein
MRNFGVSGGLPGVFPVPGWSSGFSVQGSCQGFRVSDQGSCQGLWASCSGLYLMCDFLVSGSVRNRAEAFQDPGNSDTGARLSPELPGRNPVPEPGLSGEGPVLCVISGVFRLTRSLTRTRTEVGRGWTSRGFGWGYLFPIELPGIVL